MDLPFNNMEGLRRYLLGRPLEVSIYGKIYIGKDRQDDEWVVIKRCVREDVEAKQRNGQHTPEDVLTEIDLHGRLCQEGQELCPYIIRLNEVLQDEKYIYLILEHATELYSRVSQSLFRILMTSSDQAQKELRKNEWINQVRIWIRQLLIALKFMHERKICHRDICLENIVLSGSGNLKVIDFGVAHEYIDGNFGSERQPIGSTNYMSYECYAEELSYDGRANDIWAVGVVLWCCLIGKYPWAIPSFRDRRFGLLWNNGVEALVNRSGKGFMVSEAAADLIKKIFCAQNARITVDGALNHGFIVD